MDGNGGAAGSETEGNGGRVGLSVRASHSLDFILKTRKNQGRPEAWEAFTYFSSKVRWFGMCYTCIINSSRTLHCVGMEEVGLPWWPRW